MRRATVPPRRCRRAGRRSRSRASGLTWSARAGSAAEDAIAAARAGNGPRFIEALTYRLSDHTTADDAARYRPPEEVQARWKEEPIARLRAYLVSQNAWSKSEEEQLAAACQEDVETAVERYLATGPRVPATMFDHLYAALPRAYAGQRQELGASDA